MARSFWGFGYSQPQQQQPEQPSPTQQQQAPPGGSAVPKNPTRVKYDSIAPPNGAFAPATTAVTQTAPDFSQPSFGAERATTPRGADGSSGGSPSGEARGTTAQPGASGGSAAAGTAGSNGLLAPSSAAAEPNIQMPPAEQQIKGTLRVRVIEARGLHAESAASNPYVVVSCSTSEHVSRGANTNTPKGNGGIAIPQHHSSSRLKLAEAAQGPVDPANPKWQDEAIFDITSYGSNLEVNVYDAGNNERFLGWFKFRPDWREASRGIDQWYRLLPRAENATVTGEVHVSVRFERAAHAHVGPSDFQVLRLIGKGTFGQVYQVRKRDSSRVYAMKVLSKRIIVQKKEIAHTIGERNILVRTSGAGSNFLVGLKFSFQTAQDLYLVTDYMSGGELFWHLQREGRFSEARAKFYIAELIVALEHLHNNHIVYRDLKPENILLDASGHVALCDFGLSKANLDNGTTNTFCGTTEYLAPEVLLDDKGYTKMVDFWSLGVLIFEMCCGWSPFYAEDNQQMYKNIAFGKVRFPKDALSPEGRDFVKGLLNRNPRHRLGATNDAHELMAHPFFRDVDWELLKKKQLPPPYKPHVAGEEDTSNFDPEFTNASTSVLTRNHDLAASPLSPGIQDKFKGFTFVDDTLMDEYFKGKGTGSQGNNNSAISQSFRAPPPKMTRDEGIDLYDENEIKLSHSFYDSGIKDKFANEPKGQHQRDDDEMMRVDEEDEMVDDDDRNYDDEFVEGQGFEI